MFSSYAMGITIRNQEARVKRQSNDIVHDERVDALNKMDVKLCKVYKGRIWYDFLSFSRAGLMRIVIYVLFII